jgi:general secretion pathway protein K
MDLYFHFFGFRETGKKVKITFGNDRGVALLLTLMIITILSSLAFRFHHLVQVNYSAAANLRDEMLSWYVAKSGYQVALSVLSEDDDQEVDTLEEEWALFRGSKDNPSLEVNGGQFTCQIVDENRKIAVNSFIKDDGTVDDEKFGILKRLIDIFGAEDEVLDPLLDWIDGDQELRPSGAEGDYYLRLEDPYPCKDGPLDTLAELSLIRDYSEVFGKDLMEGINLRNFITTAATDGKININTADPLILQALSKEIDEELAQRIVEFREDDPFDTKESVKHYFEIVEGITGIYGQIENLITVKSDYFSLTITGEVTRSSSSLFAMVKRTDKKLDLIYFRRN